jgi:hypothetical protein
LEETPQGLVRLLYGLASIAIAVHLLAVLASVLAARSGPWVVPVPTVGESPAEPPPFAQALDSLFRTTYLTPLRLTYNYHFLGNRPEQNGVRLEVRLRDESKNEMATLEIPGKSANPWVRHRQSVLARALGDDQPVPPPQGEVVAPPGQKLPTVEIWREVTPRTLKIEEVDVNHVPRERTVMRPSERSRIQARAYARYLCRVHGAASAQIIRHHREPVLSGMVFLPQVPEGTLEEVTSDFGDLPR